jgi:hypothetical protein
MPVVIEGFVVIVRNTTLEIEYPGGTSGFAEDCPNNTYCTDDVLSRVGFMRKEDALEFLTELGSRRLKSTRTEGPMDAVVVSQWHGLLKPCDWLEIGSYKGIPIAWARNFEPTTIVAPPGWSPDRQLFFLTNEEARERLEFLRTENNIDVYRDKLTGKELYVGRTSETKHSP